MKLKNISAALMIIVSAAAYAQQGTATPVVHERQENQQKRIAEGIKDGELNSKETEKLEKREEKIQQDKKAAKADGNVTPEERAKLRHEENRTSRHIYNQKHDAQKRK